MSVPSRSSRGGFTLLEVAVSALMFVLLMATLGVVSTAGNNAYRATSLATDLDTSGRRTLNRVADELTTIGGMNMFPDPKNDGTEVLDFYQALGVVNGQVTWGPLTRIGFEYETGEVDDGQDNDGDGIVDEGQVVLTRDVGGASEKRVVLCHDVRELALGEVVNGLDDNGNGLIDEGGFNIQLVGDVMTLRLWLEASGGGDQTIIRQNQATVRLRNAGIGK